MMKIGKFYISKVGLVFALAYIFISLVCIGVSFIADSKGSFVFLQFPLLCN